MKKLLDIVAVLSFFVLFYVYLFRSDIKAIEEMKTGSDYVSNFILAEDISTLEGAKAHHIINNYIL